MSNEMRNRRAGSALRAGSFRDRPSTAAAVGVLCRPMKRTILPIALAALALTAAAVCHNLTLTHVTGSSGSSWFDSTCSDKPGAGTANCAAVLASPYSYFPPKTSEPSAIPRIRSSVLGFLYFSGLAAWMIGVGQPSPVRRRWHLLPLFAVGMGLAFSVYFVVIMFTKLNEWCPWCMVTHGLNLLIAAGVVLLWPSKRTVEAAGPSTRLHPSGRVLVLTSLFMVAVQWSGLNMVSAAGNQRADESNKASFDSCMAAVEGIKRNTELMVELWNRGEAKVIPSDLGAHSRDRSAPSGGPEPLNVLIVSDFECPACERFAKFFEQSASPMFGGRIRLTFWHYPIDQKCNELAGATLHPHACEAAKLAEAVAEIKGEAGFWEIHDFLFSHRTELASGLVDEGRINKLILVDPLEMKRAAQSQAVSARIRGQIAAARAIGISGTPAIFVEGKPVDQLVKNDPGFWDAMAERYWKQSGVARPASTRPQNQATPGSPGRTGGP